MTDFSQFLDKVELIYYDNEYHEDNEEDEENHEEIYDDLIGGGVAFDLCRGVIGEQYIEDVFDNENIMGYIVKIKGEYAGFILFKKQYDFLYLSLVATTDDKELKKGIPLGQLLIFIMEQVAIKSGIKTIVADAVVEALGFYEKNGWNVISENKKDKMYFIEKRLSDNDESETEDTFDDLKTEYGSGEETETDEETEYDYSDEETESENDFIIKPSCQYDEDGDVIMKE
jgi:hypothetical protein